MKNSSQSISSSKSKISQNRQFQNSRTKSSFIRKFKTEDFSLRKKLMNQDCFGKIKVFLKEYQQHIYLVLEEPSSSTFAKLFQLVLFLSILLSSITITIDSIFDTQNEQYNSISVIIELYLFIFFASEYVLRLITASAFDRSFINFILSPMTLIDLLAILPFILNQTLTQGSFQQLRVLRLIRFSRIFRLFKLSRFMKAIAVLAETVKSSLKDILMLIVMLIVMVLLFSTIIYYLEYDEGQQHDEDTINSIPDAIWWCIVTMTTVGYGDLIPHTIQGKFIASIAAILGTTTISLPVAIMGINLFRTIKENEETVEIEKLKSTFENQKDQISNDQLNIRELQYMENRLEKLYNNNLSVLQCLEESQELYDELTTNLMSLYTALAEELDLHFEFGVKRLKMKQRIMKIEKNIQQKKSIELNQLIHSYREKKQIIAASPMLEESRIESANSMNSRLQSYGTKRTSRVNQMQRLRSSFIFRSAREINSEINSDANIDLKSQNAISNLQSVPHVTDPMEDTPVCINNQKIQSQLDLSSRDEDLAPKSDNEDCDIQNKIQKLQ